MKSSFLHSMRLTAVAMLVLVPGAFAQDAATTNAAPPAPGTPNLKIICALNVIDPVHPPVFPRCDKVVGQAPGYSYNVDVNIHPWKWDAGRGMGVWNTDPEVPLPLDLTVPAGDVGKVRLFFWQPHGISESRSLTEDVALQGKKIGEVKDARGVDGQGEWVEGTYSADDTKDGKLHVVITKTGKALNAFLSGFEVISTK